MIGDAKLKPSKIAEWHNMCVDRAHAGTKKWVGKIPPEQMDQPGSSGRRTSERFASLEEQAKGKKKQ